MSCFLLCGEKFMPPRSKNNVAIPAGLTLKLDRGSIVVTGPKGKVSRRLPVGLEFELKDDLLHLEYSQASKASRAMAGTLRSHLENMFKGVSEGFSKRLVIEGIGYRVRGEGGTLIFELGFSHPIQFPIPEGIEAVVVKDSITISGVDRELVGSVAAKIRSLRPPDPYKGKGIRYESEVLRLKPGKRAVGAA